MSLAALEEVARRSIAYGEFRLECLVSPEASGGAQSPVLNGVSLIEVAAIAEGPGLSRNGAVAASPYR